MSYTKMRELGRGGFGQVFQVRDQIGQLFAMKVFCPHDQLKVAIANGQLDEGELKRRFLKEVRYQSQIQSANVVKIYSHDLAVAEPWYVMELADGTLQDDLNFDRSLGNSLKPALFDILSGLEAIHELGITHRDLKPVNILRFRNPDGTVRYAISDFGLITALSSDTTTITQTGHGGGTQAYAAPELITNFKYAGPTADIYSFGAILHDIFAGVPRAPYQELSVPGICRAIVEKCTKRLPSRRYQDVATLRAALFDALNAPNFSFASGEEADVIGFLTERDDLTDDEWDRVFYLLDGSKTTSLTHYNIFRAIRIPHLDSLAASSPELMNALSARFSDYVRKGSHDWDYCDVLADKLEGMFQKCSVAIQAHILLTLLVMGVSHNRWFVERKLLRLAGPNLSDNVARRMVLDANAEGIDLGAQLSGWERSIQASRNSLHPVIAAAI